MNYDILKFMEKLPKVGIGVMILKGNKVLLGQRKGSHGEGEWAFPGGHLEHMESILDCARRETKEECGIEIANIRFLFLSNLKTYAPKHYVHVGLIADWQSGEPQILEPDSCEEWGWFDLNNIPTPLFNTCATSFEARRTGRNFYDS